MTLTAQQQSAYRAAMWIGRTRGLNAGASTWTYYPPPTQDAVTGEPILVSAGTRTLYVVEEKLSAWGQPLPPQPVGVIPYRLVAPIGTDIAAGSVIVSSSFAFTIGEISLDQGFPTGLVTKCGVPSAEVGIRDTAGYYILDTASRYILDTTGL